MNRYKCMECSNIHDETALLQAPNPFDATDTVCGCPSCKSVDSEVLVCDEPGCNKEASCGWQSPTGYRHTCYEHSCWSKDEK